jgi:glucosylglycerate synthase
LLAAENALGADFHLAEDILLGDDFLRQLMSVGEVDLLVAIPTYNNAGTVTQAIQAIENSYQQNFVRDRVVILNVDGGSTDHTTEAILNMNGRKAGAHRGITSLRTVHRVTTQYGRTPSQGMALRTILAAADLLRAKSCAIVSPATTTLDPSWVASLLRPAYRQDFAFVAPLYARTKFQGLLARNLLYPMSRAVFGLRIREMYADEWGFSGRLATQCLGQNLWGAEAVRARPEAWMAVTAICSGMKCCQSFLGPKAPPPAGSGLDIVETIRQTVGNLFWCFETFQEHWMDRSGTEAVPAFGSDHELMPEDAPASQEKSFELFRTGVKELDTILSSILRPDTLSQIRGIAAVEGDKFRFDSDLWVRTLYEFAASYHRTVIARDHILQALVPLYRGQLYSFLLEHRGSSIEEMETDSEALCLEFERQKPYLIERWKAKS